MHRKLESHPSLLTLQDGHRNEAKACPNISLKKISMKLLIFILGGFLSSGYYIQRLMKMELDDRSNLDSPMWTGSL